MKVSVVICTWNRAHMLRRCLSRMMELIIPNDIRWELLIVNNNCTDDTDKVIKSASSKLPIYQIHELKQGKSHALNHALQVAKGDYIIFTDDDVLVDSAWIVEYCKAFQQWSDAAIFGGPIHLEFEGQMSNWFSRVWPSVKSIYAYRDLGEEPVLITEETTPFGANLAIRAEEHRHYKYDPRLGPRLMSSMKSEETALLIKMIENGIRGRWVPSAKVTHVIPVSRQTIQYIERVFFSLGKSFYLYPNKVNQPAAMLFGRPRWLWKYVLKIWGQYLVNRIFKSPEIWIEDLKRASLSAAQLYYYRGIRNE